jgi:branched-chain amino acid transport system permease protein
MAQVINGIVLAAIYLLFSLGLTLSWGVLDVLNMAHGAVFMGSAYVAFVISEHLNLPLVVLCLIAVVSGGVFTVALDTIVFRRIRGRSPDRQHLELTTLIAGVGVGTIIEALVQARTADTPFSIAYVPKMYHIGGNLVTLTQICIVALGVILAIALGISVQRSRFGRAIRAVAYDRETCGLVGIDSRLLAAGTMLIAGALAGLAGFLLLIYLGSLTPESGSSLLLKGFAVIILGGVGSIRGTIVGACVLALSETLVVVYTSGTLTDAASFGIILVVVLLRPAGLFPRGSAERA